MQKGQTKGTAKLEHLVWTRINNEKFRELQGILKQTKDETISSAVRKILYNRPIKIYVRDETADLLLEEMTGLRSEIKSIGVNINQITRYFNTYPEDDKKKFYAKIGFAQYLQLDGKINRLLEIIAKCSNKWLSG